MALKLDSLSFSQVQLSLTNYFNSQTDSGKWKDFYASSTGSIFIRLLSTFGSFISYLVTVARREVYLSYAQNRTSLIGIAQNLGYSVSRGKNEVVQLVITPNMTGLIPAYTSIGTVKNYEIVTVEGTQLNKGVSSTISVYLGNLMSESITIDTEGLKIFRFISSNVSDYVRLKLNDIVIPSSINSKDLWNDMYLTISNPLGAVDVAYIQEGVYKYKPTDILTLEYIELSNVSYKITDLIIDKGTITSVNKVLSYITPEPNDSIRIKAPLCHETQVLVRARNDYLKEFKNLGYNFSDTNSRDFTPAIVDLSYVRNDYTIMTSSEETSIVSQLDNMRAMGVPIPIIKEPVHFKLEIDFDIKRNSNSIVNIIDVEADVASITESYEKTMRPSIDLELLEKNIDDFSYVKRTRISVHATNRINSTKYRLGDFIASPLSGSKVYMAYDFIRNSDTLEPSWVYTDGSLIVDNGLVWQCIPRYGKNPPTWYASRSYKLGDLVRSTSIVDPSIEFMFECIAIQKYSGTIIPSFTTVLQDFTEDNGLIWVCKSKIASGLAWTPSTMYNIGDSILEGEFSYEVVGFRGTSSGSLPVFKDIEYYELIWVDIPNYTFRIAGDKTQHILVNDTIQVQESTGNDGYYTVVSSTFSGGNTDVVVSQVIPSSVIDGKLYLEDTLTRDGDILWKYFDENEVLFNYGWNNL